MALVELLYLVLIVCVVVITVTAVWLSSELMGLIKSLKRSASDTEAMTSELKEKVLLVSEAMDRAGTAATKIIGMIEDGVESIKQKRDQITGSLGVLAGVGDFYKQKKQQSQEVKKDKTEDREADDKQSNPKDKESVSPK